MKIKYFKFLLFSLLIIFSITISCRKEDDYLTDTSVKLCFSSDSITFDTVFTTIGSTTKLLKVYNNEKKPILISYIKLAGGKSSNFRINVDGISGTEFQNVEIKAKDSLWIFVRVTVDPGNQNTPFIITDSIIFNINQNIQNVKLSAWGQDAYYHTPNVFINGLPPFSYASCKTSWPNDKPHVIYGYLVIDTDSTLVIKEGTKIHLYKNSVIWVYNGGSIKVKGTKNNPVIFQGTRLENYYSNIPGQWGKIWLSAGSKNNIINYAIIKNGTIGIQADTIGSTIFPTLTLTNSIIMNMSATALWGQGSYIRSYNSVFANCGLYSAVISIGGNYEFKHCTFANFWNYNMRNTPTLLINNYYKDYLGNYQVRNLENAYFGNCIIYGNNTNEIILDKFSSTSVFNYSFVNCLIRTTENVTDTNYFKSIINNQDPLFVNYQANDYRLTANSPAVNAGKQLYIYQDILGNYRDIAPDIGAYEYLP
ncbi:MAG TPA: choice-of-anchor Q domain-containing protein [Bacteroidales bacterium]|nr:choice-of-anchor Q domain-containing protein [Bacteroidales bacterium]